MFGTPKDKNTHEGSRRAAAADVARIEGGGLVQFIVTELTPMTFYLFLNERAVPQVEVESLSVAIDAGSGGAPTVRATLARYIKAVTGETAVQRTELFPCTLQIVALGRRITITGSSAGSLEGMWISLGLKPDGSDSEVSGARALQILVTEGILDARITWNDGETEDLLPQ